MKRHRQTAPAAGAASSIHHEAGERVRQNYSRYTGRLAAFHTALAGAVINQTPGQLAILESAAPVVHGYQILPKIIPDAPSATLRLHSSHYSWPATQALIDHAMAHMSRAEKQLRKAASLGRRRQQQSYQQLARSYRHLRDLQHNIDAHIQYNRLWQSDILARRASYDRWTALHDAVLERQQIRDRLELLGTEWASKVVAILGRFSQRLSALKNRLVQREKLLDTLIDAAAGELRVPAYVRLERRPGAWIVHVPLYTDIENRDFVSSVKKEVENIWRLRRGDDEFRVVLEHSYVPVSELYGDAERPLGGDRIDDTQRHLARFPLDGAILTTGAVTTHVYGRALILGPHEISPRVLAHEFGHILGFKDNYFRGYRDLGKNGFEVVEVIAAHDDIMGSPASGEVRQGQFMRLLQAMGGPL